MRKDETDNLKYEFLPAALEITETPAHPFGRIVLWSLVSLLIVVLTWSYFGRIDIVATARGKVVPDGNVKVVQSPVGGIATAIKVNDGDVVQKGDLLVELDATSVAADVASAERNIAIARLERDVSRKLTLNENVDSIIDESSAPNEVKADIRSLAQSRVSAYQVQRQFAATAVGQSESQLGREQNNLAKAQQSVAQLQDRRKEAQALYDRANGLDKVAAQSQLAAISNQLAGAEATLQTMLDRVSQARASLVQSKSNLASLESDNSTSTLASVVEQDKVIAGLESDLEKAKKTVSDQSVYAPVSGTVMALSVNTLGAVVAPAQQLAFIVPLDTPLLIEASLQNQDIGFIHVGQRVAVKLDTYSFQRYGTLEGEVVGISPDAIQDENGGRSTYKLKVSIKKSKSSKDIDIPLLSGMAVTSEIKTGDRRIISFFLDPLIAGLDGSLKSR